MSIGARRAARWSRLGAERFQLLIIGGGIVGAGIARDAAMRGVRVALIEQGDFAGGTSSKTSKLIHGGLRYLEHGQLGLVAESLRERHILRTIAPGLIHPLAILLPLYAGGSRRPAAVRVGLGIYDLLAGAHNVRPHRMLSARRAVALEPKLRIDGLRAAGLYVDCLMDDARVCLSNALQAESFGAVCVNYVRVRALPRADGRLAGAAIEDTLTGRSQDVQAEVVVNATGPWGDAIRRLSVPEARPRLAPSKGIHLIVPRLADQALFLEARDRRMIFLLPWHGYTLVGTTESPVDGPLEDLAATGDDVAYLLDAVNDALPGSRIREADIIATFAGARPLLAHSGPTTSASREHQIDVDRHGLVSVLGGKFTTYRAMARQAVDRIAREQGWRLERCLTGDVSLIESPQPIGVVHWRELVQDIDGDMLARLLMRYGTGALRILRMIEAEPGLGQRVCPHHEVLLAELAYGVLEESACTMTDLLARRTAIAWSSCQGLDLVSSATDMLRRYGGLSAQDAQTETEAYMQFLARGLSFRPLLESGGVWAGAAEAEE